MFNPDDHKKTARGLLPSFAEIFTGARYAPRLYSDRQHDYHKPEVFVWTERAAEFNLPQSRNTQNGILVATGTPAFWEYFDSRECGSIRLIPWEAHGVFLVVASRADYVGEQWHAWVPMDQSFEVQQ